MGWKILDNISAGLAYLYFVCFIGMILTVIGAIDVLNTLIQVYIYPPPIYGQYPNYEYGFVRGLAQMIVGIPLWAYHWYKLGKQE
ncbi:MAG: DUF5671 domain-containing protein [Methanocellales archaeon]|nr:DUF5671 domain-containing protein [Methanocellales archaeon]MDD4898550.1 DUF5671 domain-containing protein [Methanocellales archaeon]MDD5447118.1 DUF5671 domain-containing protein [Methanocellales archaeon]